MKTLQIEVHVEKDDLKHELIVHVDGQHSEPHEYSFTQLTPDPVIAIVEARNAQGDYVPLDDDLPSAQRSTEGFDIRVTGLHFGHYAIIEVDGVTCEETSTGAPNRHTVRECTVPPGCGRVEVRPVVAFLRPHACVPLSPSSHVGVRPQ